MNRNEFLEALSARMGGLPEAERRRVIDYYAEMIDDRIEEGVPEAEAVAALGDVEALARALPRSGGGAPEQPASEAVAALNGLRIRVANADVTVLRAPLANGAAAQLRFSDPSRFRWRMDGDVLEIAELEEGRRRLFQLRQPSATVTLSDALAGSLDFDGNGGDLTLDGVAVGGGVRLDSQSGDIVVKGASLGADAGLLSRGGDIELSGLEVRGALSVKTASGDISASKLDLGGDAALEAAGGDIELRDVRCGALRLAAASGDIELDRGRAGVTRVRAASGDVRLDELESDPELDVETASGDIDLARCIARETRLRSGSGDVTARLAELPCGYDISVNSRSGDIRFADGDAPAQPGVPKPKIVAQTVSGDIDIGVVK